jgi:hypothetical protein
VIWITSAEALTKHNNSINTNDKHMTKLSTAREILDADTRYFTQELSDSTLIVRNMPANEAEEYALHHPVLENFVWLELSDDNAYVLVLVED